MSNDQFIRLQATQAGPFNESQSVVDIYLPGDGVYDLHDSFVSVYASMTTTETNAARGTGVYSTALKLNGTTNHIQNALLVKNCSMSCQARGQLENIRRQDILHAATSSLGKSQRQDASNAYLDANTLVEPKGQLHYSIFQDINKQGTTLSSQKETPIQIRLGDIMDAGNIRLYDGRRLGQTHIRLELNAPDAAGTGGLVRGYQTIPEAITSDAKTFEDIEDPLGAYNWTTLVINNKRTAGTDLRGMVSETQYPYYVGCKIAVSATEAGGAPAVANVETVITGITYDKTTSQVTLTVAPALSTMANGNKYTGVVCTKIVQPASVSLAFNRVELTVKRLGNPPPVNEKLKLNYTTWSTQQDQGVPNATSFQRQYPCEPDADACLITFPDVAGIFSTNTDIDSYRLRINEVDVTDRDVAIDSPLYYDRLSALIQTMGYNVRDLQQNAGDCTARNYPSTYAKAGGANGTTISTAGTTYAAKTIVALTGGAGSGCVIYIQSVSGAGAITGITVLDPGQGYAATNILTVPGGDGAGRVTVDSILSSNKQVYAGCKMPRTLREKQLQVNVDLSAGDVNQIVLFKRRPRQIEL